MLFTIQRGEEPRVTKMITVIIGGVSYRISETVDGKLNINKTSDSDSDLIRIHPRTGNEIELS